MTSRFSALLVAVGAVAALSGCGDPTGTRPNSPTREGALTVYAMTGSPLTFPTALIVRAAGSTFVDGSFSFDVAFDLRGADSVVLYTPRALASELAAPRRVGLQVSGRAFNEIKDSPTSDFVYDSSLVIPVARGTVLVDVLEPSCFQSFFGPNIRAKFTVDSVNTTTRAIYLSILSNPNCGLKSLEPGVHQD